MYGRTGNLGAHPLRGVGRLRGLRGRLGRLGDDSTDADIANVLTAGITTAGSVASVALKPPTYSETISPSGVTSIQSYAPLTSIPGVSSGIDPTTLLLLGGGLLLVIVMMAEKRHQ